MKRSNITKKQDFHIVKLKHPLRWLSAIILFIILFFIVNSMINNPRYGWDVVIAYMFDSRILNGIVVTVYLTAIVMLVSIILGTILAVMRMSDNIVSRYFSMAYLWFFRSIPMLVMLLITYNISALYPSIVISIPFTGLKLFAINSNEAITPFLAALLAMGIHESAYTCEFIRGGLLSVEYGQRQAAQTLGMTEILVFRRIVFPQSLRVIVPALGNQTIGMLKYTSLVSVIAMSDLLYSAQRIYQQNFEVIPLLIVACTWYILGTTILMIIQHYIEQYYGRSESVG